MIMISRTFFLNCFSSRPFKVRFPQLGGIRKLHPHNLDPEPVPGVTTNWIWWWFVVLVRKPDGKYIFQGIHEPDTRTTIYGGSWSAESLYSSN
jgi:hypothetical protein